MNDDAKDIRAARERADCLVTGAAVEHAVDQLAVRLAIRLDGSHPIVMCVMNGGLILTAELLLRLHFPLEVSYVHATRYNNATSGLTWLEARARSCRAHGAAWSTTYWTRVIHFPR
jgi:hypoxanthine phosphoribosyltransferase